MAERFTQADFKKEPLELDDLSAIKKRSGCSST